jgi:hypothetical protein
MHKRQVAAYVACLIVFVACVAQTYDALFPSPSTAPQEATVGLANGATTFRSDASKAAVPPFSVSRLHEDVSVAPDPAAEQGAGLTTGQRDTDTSAPPLSTIGKSEPQSDEPSPSGADKTLTSADRQGREENVGEGHRNGYQVRTVHRGGYYSYRRRNADENSFFGRERYETYANRDYTYGHRDQYNDNYPRRESSAFVHGDRDRNSFRFGQWGREDKTSKSRQSRGVFGTSVWH